MNVINHTKSSNKNYTKQPKNEDQHHSRVMTFNMKYVYPKSCYNNTLVQKYRVVANEG